MPEMYVYALVFACLTAVFAMFLGLRALDVASKAMKQEVSKSGVRRFAADFAELRDDLDSLSMSLRKLRNRENARHARAAKSAAPKDDDAWLKEINKSLNLPNRRN